MGIFSKKSKTAAEQKAEPVAPKTVEFVQEGKGKNALSFRVIIRPLVTEKASVLQSMNKYSFVIATWATKNQVKQAMLDLYGVATSKIHVVNMEGKRIRFGKNQGRKADAKKAIVTLPKGQTITVHEGV